MPGSQRQACIIYQIENVRGPDVLRVARREYFNILYQNRIHPSGAEFQVANVSAHFQHVDRITKTEIKY